MNKKILYLSILITGVLIALVMAGSVNAQTDGKVTPEISYPVTELSNCADKAACKVYCDQPANVDACLSFAQKNNLMSDDEIKMAKNFKKTGMTGPGGCKGKDECNAYCSGPDHMDECVTFAEKNGMMSGKQLEEAKKVQGAKAKGIKPPACGGKENCNAYCSSAEHVEECVKFAESAGIISNEDAQKIRNTGGKKGKNSGGGPAGQGSDQGQGGQDGPGGGQGSEGQNGPEGGKRGPKGPGGQGNGSGKQGPGGQGGPVGQGQGGQIPGGPGGTDGGPNDGGR